MIYRNYYGMDGDTVVGPLTMDEWLEQFGRHQGGHLTSRVAADELPGNLTVSTVFLCIDHNWGFRDPRLVLFETMVFGGEHDEYQRRWHTRAQAIAGHDQIVAALRAGHDPDESVP